MFCSALVWPHLHPRKVWVPQYKKEIKLISKHPQEGSTKMAKSLDVEVREKINGVTDMLH